MGIRGFGITQSDEYGEIFGRFMDEYDEGYDISDIASVILDEYIADFGAESGILHDVYFAIAKAQWQCGGVDPEILSKVRNIVESGSNIDFLRELGADKDGLALRKRNLQRFLKALSTPCKTVRKRRSEEAHAEKPTRASSVKNLPELKTGGCYVYKYGETYRSFIVLECIKDRIDGESVLCAINFDAYDSVPDFETVKNANIGGFGRYTADEFFNEDQLMLLGQSDMPSDMTVKMFKGFIAPCGKSDFKTANFSSEFKLNALDIAKAADFGGDASAVCANTYFNDNLGDVRVSFNGILMTMPWNKIFDIG